MQQQYPQYSPDGRFWWNGYQWVPVWHPGMPQRRSVVGYLIASIFIPGLGSLLLGRWRWGGIILGVWAVCLIAYFVAFFTSASTLFSNLPTITCANNVCTSTPVNGTFNVAWPTQFIVIAGVAGIVWLCAWIAGIVDAIRGTEEWNRTHGFA